MWLSAFDFPIPSWWKGTLCCFPIMTEAATWGWKVNNSQEKCISWILHIKDATRKVVSSPSWYIMHGFWSREEITESGRLEKHKASSDSPAVADQWSRHPCCHESGAESGQTASSVLLWFISSWVVFSLVSGALCPALLLLRRRCSCTEDLSFALLCPYLVLPHCAFALVHSSTLPGYGLPTLPLCSHSFSVPSSLPPAIIPVASNIQRLIHFSGFLFLKVR